MTFFCRYQLICLCFIDWFIDGTFDDGASTARRGFTAQILQDDGVFTAIFTESRYKLCRTTWISRHFLQVLQNHGISQHLLPNHGDFTAQSCEITGFHGTFYRITGFLPHFSPPYFRSFSILHRISPSFKGQIIA